MVKLIFVLLIFIAMVAGVFFFFKESTASAKWKVLKYVLYLVFFTLVALSILTAIVILF